jgi:hypothetical protein
MFVKYLIYFEKLIFYQIFFKYVIPTHFKKIKNIVIIIKEHQTFGTLFAQGMIKCIKLN